MSLLNTRHPDPQSAALAIARNRASKIGLLLGDADAAETAGRRDEAAQLRRIAAGARERLERDVREFEATR